MKIVMNDLLSYLEQSAENTCEEVNFEGDISKQGIVFELKLVFLNECQSGSEYLSQLADNLARVSQAIRVFRAELQEVRDDRDRNNLD